MKWLVVLLLALIIFGGATWFGYNTFVKQEIELKKEQRGEVPPPPVLDVSLPDGDCFPVADALMERATPFMHSAPSWCLHSRIGL